MGSTRRLPPGFRFHPTDVELVMYHLKRKVMGKRFHFEAISEVDIYKFAPSDLPEKSCLRTGDLKWYFFCPREKKYSSGGRVNRATEFGYWKTTGKDRPVSYNNEEVGMIKTLIFHIGKAPKGDRTDWVMHEYRLEDNHLAERVVQGSYVLCVIFKKNGHGPKNGAQYGAPFKEEDWDDDDGDEEVDCVEAVPSAGLSTPANVLPSNHDSSVATGNVLPAPATVLPSNHDSSVATGTYSSESICLGSSSVSYLSEIVRSHSKVLPPFPSNNVLSRESPQVLGDDIYSMMDMCVEDSTFNENGRNEMLDNLSHDGNAEATPFVDGFDFCIDPDNLAGLRENGYNFYTGQQATFTQDQLLAVDGAQFLELTDLSTPLNISAEAGQSQHNPTDGFYAGYNCYINSEQSCYPVHPCGAPQHISVPSQFSPLTERRFLSDNDSSHLVNPVAGAQYVSVLRQSSPPVGKHYDFVDHDQLHAVDDTQFLELTDLSSPLNISAEAGQSQHNPTDDLYAGYSCYNNSEQSCYPVNPCGAPQHISVSSQFSPLPERLFSSDNDSSHLVNPVAGAQYVSVFRQSSALVGGHYDFEDQEAAFVDKENGAYENTNRGYKGCEAALYNVYNSDERLQLESGHTQDQDQRRGEQRIPFSRLQYMLENQAPTYGEKRSQGSALLYSYGGSSIHVKAEVTLRSSGCTNDALSDKLEEFPSVCCYVMHATPRREFGRRVACSNGITFVFFCWGCFWFFIWFFVAQSSGCENWQVGVDLVLS